MVLLKSPHWQSCKTTPAFSPSVCHVELLSAVEHQHHPPPHHNRFTALFPRPPGWAGASRELLDFMVQGKINSGRFTDHPTGCHSISTNQCLPPPSPIFFTGRMSFLPPNQQHQSTEVELSAVKQWTIMYPLSAGLCPSIDIASGPGHCLVPVCTLA